MQQEREVGGIRCGEVLLLLGDVVDGELDAANLARVQAHLAGCDTCERFGGQYVAVVRRLRSELPRPDVHDDGLRRRLVERLRAAR